MDSSITTLDNLQKIKMLVMVIRHRSPFNSHFLSLPCGRKLVSEMCASDTDSLSTAPFMITNQIWFYSILLYLSSILYTVPYTDVYFLGCMLYHEQQTWYYITGNVSCSIHSRRFKHSTFWLYFCLLERFPQINV